MPRENEKRPEPTNVEVEAMIDHYIAPEAKNDKESRDIMRGWVLEHYRRGAIDVPEITRIKLAGCQNRTLTNFVKNFQNC